VKTRGLNSYINISLEKLLWHGPHIIAMQRPGTFSVGNAKSLVFLQRMRTYVPSFDKPNGTMGDIQPIATFVFLTLGMASSSTLVASVGMANLSFVAIVGIAYDLRRDAYKKHTP
jgi:hypothetical protein